MRTFSYTPSRSPNNTEGAQQVALLKGLGTVMHMFAYNLQCSPNDEIRQIKKTIYTTKSLTRWGRHSDAHGFMYSATVARE